MCCNRLILNPHQLVRCCGAAKPRVGDAFHLVPTVKNVSLTPFDLGMFSTCFIQPLLMTTISFSKKLPGGSSSPSIFSLALQEHEICLLQTTARLY